MSYAAAAYGGFQIWSGFQQADMMRQQASVNRKVMELNAELAEVDSFNALKDGMTKVSRYQSTVDSIRSMQTAIYSSKGVDSSFGSSADIISDSDRNAVFNRMDLETQAFQAAAGFENKAAQFRIQGSVNYQSEIARANATQNAAILNGAFTGISGYSGFDLGGDESTPGGSSPTNPSARSINSYMMPFGG